MSDPTNAQEASGLKLILVAMPILTAVLFVLAFGEVIGEILAPLFGIDVIVAIRGQSGSEFYMVLLMFGIGLLILAGWGVGHFLANAIMKRKTK